MENYQKGNTNTKYKERREKKKTKEKEKELRPTFLRWWQRDIAP